MVVLLLEENISVLSSSTYKLLLAKTNGTGQRGKCHYRNGSTVLILTGMFSERLPSKVNITDVNEYAEVVSRLKMYGGCQCHKTITV